MNTEMVTQILPQEQAIYLLYTILLAGLIFWLTSKIQAYVKSLIALNKVVGSFRISKNNILRFSTSTGTIDGKILNIDRKRIEIEFDDFVRTIPTNLFAEMTWDIVKANKDQMDTE
jgi:hypothetical protein